VADFDAWLHALERRHLADLTSAELTRALRALSSCYVERRGQLGGGSALEGAGKRAAFALYYGPLHFLTIASILDALGPKAPAPETIVDLGCGTGVGGAAWALASGARPRVIGIDRSAWAVAEANWTYSELGVSGRAAVGDAIRKFPGAPTPKSSAPALLLAYCVNELPAGDRPALLKRVVDAARTGARLLIVEAIAVRDKPWWPEWSRALEPEGLGSREWRFEADIPVPLRELARRAGLTLRELTARTLTNLP
jgi:SAM-dependent methyltransferase